MHAPCPRGQRAKARGKEDGDGRRGGARFPGTADGDGIEDEAKKIGTKALLQMSIQLLINLARLHLLLKQPLAVLEKPTKEQGIKIRR